MKTLASIKNFFSQERIINIKIGVVYSLGCTILSACPLLLPSIAFAAYANSGDGYVIFVY